MAYLTRSRKKRTKKSRKKRPTSRTNPFSVNWKRPTRNRSRSRRASRTSGKRKSPPKSRGGDGVKKPPRKRVDYDWKAISQEYAKKGIGSGKPASKPKSSTSAAEGVNKPSLMDKQAHKKYTFKQFMKDTETASVKIGKMIDETTAFAGKLAGKIEPEMDALAVAQPEFAPLAAGVTTVAEINRLIDGTTKDVSKANPDKNKWAGLVHQPEVPMVEAYPVVDYMQFANQPDLVMKQKMAGISG